MLVSERFTKKEYPHKLPGGDPKRQKEVFSETVQQISTCSVAVQIPCSLVSEIPVSNSERRTWAITEGILRQLCEWRQIEILEGNIQVDHIHLVLSIPPKYSISESEAIGFLKGKSAIKIFDIHHELKRRYWGRHFWSKGYCVSTIGLDEDQIRQYVRWQVHKDRKLNQMKLWKQ